MSASRKPDPEMDRTNDAVAIARLAALSPLEYDRVRNTEAERLGCRADTLDKMVRAARAYSSDDDARDSRPPAFTDEALALQFSVRHEHELRYVAAWGTWFEWTGSNWEADKTMRTFDRSRTVCREASSACNESNVASNIASAKTVAAVERLARYDRRHASTVEQWDCDPWLLNTQGGVVDLRTGKMRPHRPGDHTTKITVVAPAGDCPLWHSFLVKITNDNLELQDFLQRVAGYSLTGSTREHALFFGYGTGGNGKGVFLNTLTGIMGNYAAVASIDTFTASATDRHPTDLAMLRGARLVTAQETEEGRRWAEARIKAMTGGDPITARFMRQDFFTFHPAFKLFIAGNHKPGLRNVDEAIRRRFNLVPFDVKIPAAERDNELPEKLKAEWPGILKWAIEGCLIWQRDGLNPPDAVTSATDEYFEAEDAIGLWLGECCDLGKNPATNRSHRALSTELFSSWNEWATKAAEHVGSQKNFSQTIESRGFRKIRWDGEKDSDRGKRAFEGLSVRVKVRAHPDSDR